MKKEVKLRKQISVLTLCLLGVGTALADAPAPTTNADDAHRCVVVRTISGWSRVDDRTLIMRTSPQKKYKVTFFSPCREANWAYSARVDNFGMCLRPGDILVFQVGAQSFGPRWSNPFNTPRGGFEERCAVKSIELLPPAP